MAENVFSMLSDDVVLKIFFNLKDYPRVWARLACVCTKFSSLMHTVCWKTKCSQTVPSLVSDLLSVSTSSAPPGGWSALHKLAVCCPGLLHSGVLLENSDFGLERELGPDENHKDSNLFQLGEIQRMLSSDSTNKVDGNSSSSNVSVSGSDCPWSLYDDLYHDTICNASESLDNRKQPEFAELLPLKGVGVKEICDSSVYKRRRVCRSWKSHLASGIWNLSREQGNKLLASRFRGDCLYICDWPGCVHLEEKRNYMLFRGIFKNFQRSRVWRTISDGDRNKIDLGCAFCSCKQTWDLHSAFCLKRIFGYHDDGEPVVRAFVCENGHVSGAWTDWPLYT